MSETPFSNTINQLEQKSMKVLSMKTDEKLFEYIQECNNFILNANLFHSNWEEKAGEVAWDYSSKNKH